MSVLRGLVSSCVCRACSARSEGRSAISDGGRSAPLSSAWIERGAPARATAGEVAASLPRVQLVRDSGRAPRPLRTRYDLHRHLDRNPIRHLRVQIHVHLRRPDAHHQGIAHGPVILL